jgi:hypothetical protein
MDHSKPILIAHLFVLEKKEYDQGDGCEVHGCENQASWTIPLRGHCIENDKRFCSACAEKLLKSDEVDKQGRLAMNLARGNS